MTLKWNGDSTCQWADCGDFKFIISSPDSMTMRVSIGGLKDALISIDGIKHGKRVAQQIVDTFTQAVREGFESGEELRRIKALRERPSKILPITKADVKQVAKKPKMTPIEFLREFSRRDLEDHMRCRLADLPIIMDRCPPSYVDLPCPTRDKGGGRKTCAQCWTAYAKVELKRRNKQ